MVDLTFRTPPTVQFALRRAAFAAVSVRPKTFGTLQTREAPAGPLVVKVSVACPLPTVRTAEPAAGVFDVMTVVVPGPPGVGLTVIPVTAYPVGTFSDTVRVTP